MTRRLTTCMAALVTLVTSPLCAAQVAGAGFLSDVIVTTVDDGAEVRLNLNCSAHYVPQGPEASGRDIVLRFEATDLCGASLLGAETRRVRGGELASLVEVDYEGEGANGPELTLHFSRDVQLDVKPQSSLHELVVAVRTAMPSTPRPLPSESASTVAKPLPSVALANVEAPSAKASASAPQSSTVAPAPQLPAPSAGAPAAGGRYVLNLRSASTPFDVADIEALKAYSSYTAYETQSDIQGRTWYRLRIGFFATEQDANALKATLQSEYAGLWIAYADSAEVENALADPLLAASEPADAAGTPAVASAAKAPGAPVARSLAPAAAAVELTPEKRAALLEQGRQALATGEYSQAVQIFTKLLQKTDDDIAEVAQELLGVARERNGQNAHARVAYSQYLERYPQGEAAPRVRQRLAALTVVVGGSKSTAAARQPVRGQARTWDVNTTLWQYYRRQEAQINDDPALLSQSALLSNVDLGVRHRGESFDLQSRVALGYWYDFMGTDGDGNETRISHAYVEADGNKGNWRARVGRQSRGSAGVLGRFDGVQVSYQPRERIRLNVVTGYPVYSTRDGFDKTRTFEGVSVDIDDIAKSWDMSYYINRQTAGGILDREAVGTEVRYFDDHRSLFALADYDLLFKTLNNVYLVGNWRTRGRLTMNATVNRAHSPYLTTSNALIGQPLTSIDELQAVDTEEEIRQLAQDRTATSTTFSAGVSRPVLQKFQIDVDVTDTTYSSTATSGGVEGFPASDYKYYSVSLMGQSLVKEGDMGILSFRVGDTTSYKVTGFSIDGRYPVRGLRINPRLRVDQRTRLTDGSKEIIYQPLLRMQFNWHRRYYLEFEGGMYLSNRKLDETTNDFKTTYFNIGYRCVF